LDLGTGDCGVAVVDGDDAVVETGVTKPNYVAAVGLLVGGG